ncbi:MAG TPA: PP2C family protein-serine/threonine phosphatase [Spirochaetota bacterium]|nr:PP2C family protein-serine/threonine phosphatase [Spirochaetota bacterium]
MNEIRKPSDIISGELEAGKFYRKGRGFVFPGKKHEKIFRDHYYPETLLYARFATIIGLSLYLLNIFNDVTMFPELKSVSLVIRIGCSVGAMAMFAFSFRPAFRRVHEWMLFSISIVASCGIVLFTYLGSGVPALLYHSGVMLCMMFLFAFLRIRFVLATLSGWIIALSYIVPHAMIGDIGRMELMHNSMNLVGIVIVGMSIAYMNEYAARYSFAQTLVIEEKNRDLKERNARMEQDLELAKAIQEQYLPKTSPSPHICAHYMPMEKIGGDFYEFITFDDEERTGIFISDVAGHGVPAALIASMLKITIASSGALKMEPASLMVHINDIMCRHVNSNFITCIYCIVDRASRTVTYSMAGHSHPILINGSSVDTLPTPRSLPLGLFSSAELTGMGKGFSTTSIGLPAGSKLLLYTDGLTEARRLSDPDSLFEYCEMYDAIKRLAHLPCRDFTRGLYESLVYFRGSSSFEDDICMVCVDIA